MTKPVPMDIEYIKKQYRTLPDEKIISLATTEARGLREEIVPVLIEEIRSRALNERIIEGLERQLKKATPEELNHYAAILQACPCPHCGSSSSKLNGIVITNTVSLILFTWSGSTLYIACLACITKFKGSANVKTILLGWWGFPWGPIRSIKSLINNSALYKQSLSQSPSPVLLQFVDSNIGQIEIQKDNHQGLSRLIRNN